MNKCLKLLSLALLVFSLGGCIYTFETDRVLPLDMCDEVPELDNVMLYFMKDNGEHENELKVEKIPGSIEYKIINPSENKTTLARFLKLRDGIYLTQMTDPKDNEHSGLTLFRLEGDHLNLCVGEGYEKLMDKIVEAGFPKDKIRYKYEGKGPELMILDLKSDEDLKEFIKVMKSMAQDIPFCQKKECEQLFLYIRKQ